MAFKFFMLAGEASGDAHASRLMEALKAAEPTATFVGMGGPKMAAAGLDVAKDLEGMQVLGIWEVVKNYGFFRDVFYKMLDRVKQEKPDALICVDYPGFNLRFAKEVKKLGIPILYYIVPQVWAWKAMRAKKMAGFVDRAYCVFEFERAFFEKYGLKTEFVGHPLVDNHGTTKEECGLKLPPGPKTVAFLPGSRKSEVISHTYPMSLAFGISRANRRALMSFPRGTPQSAVYFANFEMATGRASTDRVNIRGVLTSPSVLISGRANEEMDLRVLQQSHSTALPSLADFSVVKSGTSTLEAGLAGNPMCSVYKANRINFAIANLLVNIPVMSLVNIVLGRYAIPELIQEDVTPGRIAAEIERGLNDQKYREQQKAALAELPGKLGGPGCSSRAAKSMIDFLKGRG
jgi:lipid-A-disaccharide synthase